MLYSISKKYTISFIIVSLLGFLDAVYLTVKHYSGQEVTCTLTGGCNTVLTSKYASLIGLPTSLWGALYYLTILICALLYLNHQKNLVKNVLLYFTVVGFITSVFLVYLQIFILHSICPYCMFSAATSTTLFIFSLLNIFQSKNNLYGKNL